MKIYKTVFDNEQQGKDYLIAQGVWEEVTDEGVINKGNNYTHINNKSKTI